MACHVSSCRAVSFVLYVAGVVRQCVLLMGLEEYDWVWVNQGAFFKTKIPPRGGGEALAGMPPLKVENLPVTFG